MRANGAGIALRRIAGIGEGFPMRLRDLG